MIKKFVSTTLGVTGLAVLIGASGIMCALNTAQAQYVGPVEMQSYKNVAGILKNPVDDTIVTLRGNITKQTGHDMYRFSDGSGTINAKIGPKEFAGQQIGANTRVEIWGEVDPSRDKPVKIDVKRLTVVK